MFETIETNDRPPGNQHGVPPGLRKEKGKGLTYYKYAAPTELFSVLLFNIGRINFKNRADIARTH